MATGSMSERPKDSGTWRLRVVVEYDPVTRRAKQAYRTFHGSKKQAQVALAKFVTDVAEKKLAVNAKMPLRDYLGEWLDSLASREPTTVRGYRSKVNTINRRLGQVRLDKLTAIMLDKAYQAWLTEPRGGQRKDGAPRTDGGKPLSPASVHHIHAVLSTALEQAVVYGILPSAPTTKASPPPLRLKQIKVPLPATVQRLAEHQAEKATAGKDGRPTDRVMYAAATVTAAATGVRRGELCGFQWSDFETDGTIGKLTVHRVIKHNDGPGWHIGPPKTHQQRTIPIDDFLTGVLLEYREHADSAAAGSLTDDRWIFSLDPTGHEWLIPDTFSQNFRRNCNQAGVTNVTPHTLRHFMISVLIASGKDWRTVAARAGHSNPAMTLGRYSWALEGGEADADAAAFIGAVLANARVSRGDKGGPVDFEEPTDAEGAGDLPPAG